MHVVRRRSRGAVRSASSHGTSRVLLAVQQPHGNAEGDRTPLSSRQCRPSSISARVTGVGVAVRLGHLEPPSLRSRARSWKRQRSHISVLGEVGRRGDADQRRQPLRPRQRGQQRDPAAHGGADEQQRPSGSTASITASASSRQRPIVPSSNRPPLAPWPE